MSGRPRYFCITCGQHFKSQSKLAKHITRKHNYIGLSQGIEYFDLKGRNPQP